VFILRGEVFKSCAIFSSLNAYQVTGKQQFLGKNIRLEQLMMNEIEFEWLRQFYIQGEKHRQLHVWWHQPMQVHKLAALICMYPFTPMRAWCICSRLFMRFLYVL